jgi:hypothetical protein
LLPPSPPAAAQVHVQQLRQLLLQRAVIEAKLKGKKVDPAKFMEAGMFCSLQEAEAFLRVHKVGSPGRLELLGAQTHLDAGVPKMVFVYHMLRASGSGSSLRLQSLKSASLAYFTLWCNAV